MKSQMQYLRKAEIANVEVDYFKHRNYMVGSVERMLKFILSSVLLTGLTNYRQSAPWDSKRSGVGLNSVSSSYQLELLKPVCAERREKRTQQRNARGSNYPELAGIPSLQQKQ